MAAPYERLPVYWRYRRCRGARSCSGDCRLRLRLRCLAEAVFKAIDVGFSCNPVVLDQFVFQFYRRSAAVHLVFFMALIMMSCMSLRLDSAPNARVFTSRLVLWSIATGAVFSFLDFLTIPAAVVALHCFFAFIALPEGERPKRCVVTMLQALFGFGLSFVFTWAMKWVVAAFVLGWDEVFSNVLGEMGLWSAHETSSLLPQADWPQILKEFYCMSPQLFAICSTAGYALISNVVFLVSFAAVCNSAHELAP